MAMPPASSPASWRRERRRCGRISSGHSKGLDGNLPIGVERWKGMVSRAGGGCKSRVRSFSSHFLYGENRRITQDQGGSFRCTTGTRYRTVLVTDRRAFAYGQGCWNRSFRPDILSTGEWRDSGRPSNDRVSGHPTSTRHRGFNAYIITNHSRSKQPSNSANVACSLLRVRRLEPDWHSRRGRRT